MALLVAKVPFWEGASKGGFTICGTQKLCSAENSFADMKECNLKKNKTLPIRGCLPKCKKVFFGPFLCFLVVCFFCVFVLLFCKRAQKGYLPAMLEFFICLLFVFCSPGRPVIKIFFFQFAKLQEKAHPFD